MASSSSKSSGLNSPGDHRKNKFIRGGGRGREALYTVYGEYVSEYPGRCSGGREALLLREYNTHCQAVYTRHCRTKSIPLIEFEISSLSQWLVMFNTVKLTIQSCIYIQEWGRVYSSFCFLVSVSLCWQAKNASYMYIYIAGNSHGLCLCTGNMLVNTLVGALLSLPLPLPISLSLPPSPQSRGLPGLQRPQQQQQQQQQQQKHPQQQQEARNRHTPMHLARGLSSSKYRGRF